MTSATLIGIATALALLPAMATAAPVKKHHRSHTVAPRAAIALPVDPERGNAALGGNNANSASGSNSAGENANGRTGGGFGGQ
jgi:hypothetical protein